MDEEEDEEEVEIADEKDAQPEDAVDGEVDELSEDEPSSKSGSESVNDEMWFKPLPYALLVLLGCNIACCRNLDNRGCG